MHNITDHSCPVLAPGARLATDKRTGQPVLLYPEGVVELSPSAHAIIRRCNGQVTTGGIVAALTVEFEGAPEAIREDVIECLSRLWQRKLILLT